MARKGGERFQKREREKAKREKAKAKAARKEERQASDDSPEDEDDLLQQFHRLNQRYAAGEVAEATFESRKREILEELGIDAD